MCSRAVSNPDRPCGCRFASSRFAGSITDLKLRQTLGTHVFERRGARGTGARESRPIEHRCGGCGTSPKDALHGLHLNELPARTIHAKSRTSNALSFGPIRMLLQKIVRMSVRRNQRHHAHSTLRDRVIHNFLQFSRCSPQANPGGSGMSTKNPTGHDAGVSGARGSINQLLTRFDRLWGRQVRMVPIPELHLVRMK